MKISVAILILAMCAVSSAQQFPPEPSAAKEIEKLCQSVNAVAEKKVKAWNTSHPKERLYFQCGPAWGWNDKALGPRITVPLSPQEKTVLNQVRTDSDAAFSVENSYEKFLLRKHRITHWELPDKVGPVDPCYRFAGIVVDTDYISVDPLPPNCAQESK